METLSLWAAFSLAESLEPFFRSGGQPLGPGGVGSLALDIFRLASEGYDRQPLAVELARCGWDLEVMARAAPRIDFAMATDYIILGLGYDPRDPTPEDDAQS